MKRIIKKGIVFIFMFIYLFNYKAFATKDNNINFQNLTVDDALSQSLAEYIYQDSNGYIWIGTLIHH